MSTATLDFNQPAQCHHSWGMRRCKSDAAWQNPSKNVRKQLSVSAQLISQDVFCFRRQCSWLLMSWSSRASSAAKARRCFFWMKSCQIVFDALSVGESRPGSFAALQAQRSRLALAFHTRSAVKACDRPQTLQPTAPSYPRPSCLANYEYSAAMKVILSDMQLSSQIVSAALFVVFERRTSQGHDHSSPLVSDFDMYEDKNWV